jgi:hypothetical protein
VGLGARAVRPGREPAEGVVREGERGAARGVARGVAGQGGPCRGRLGSAAVEPSPSNSNQLAVVLLTVPWVADRRAPVASTVEVVEVEALPVSTFAMELEAPA